MSQLNLNYRKYGSGRPIVILHGLFGSLVNWETICEALEQHFEVYALDLRNHGDSPHGDRFDYGIMADDLKRFILQRQLSDSIILGHSLGGKVAMTFAVTYPEDVAKLIVVDIAPKTYPADKTDIIDAMLTLELSRLFTLKQVVEALAVKIPDLPTRYFLVKNIVRNPDDGFRWKINLKGIRDNITELSKGLPQGMTFNKPTLFIRGVLSTYIEDRDFSLINRFFPQSQVLAITGAGHWVHIDAPEEFIRAVLSFVH